MDIHDASDSSQYHDALNKQKQTLLAARKRRGQIPKDRDARETLVGRHMQMYFSIGMLNTQPHTLRSSFLAEPYLPSIVSVKDLRKTFVKQLKLETHHRGFYLLLRTITPPIKMTAIMRIAEDEQEDVTPLHAYHQDDKVGTSSEIDASSVCILKEPYFKIMSDGKYGLRVDHVSDLIWLPKDDDRVPLQWRPPLIPLKKTGGEWKEEGNDAFKAGKLLLAAEKYSSALRSDASPQEAQTIHLNRSLVNYRLTHYDAALEDAQLALSAESSVKGLYRAASASYELRKYEDCVKFLKRLLPLDPVNGAGKNLLARVNVRLEEPHKGQYDFKAMYRELETSPHLDHATYVGPLVIKQSEGRGRGVFTTRPVDAGELLLCEKAFACCFSSEIVKNDGTDTTVLINIQTNRITIGTHSELIAKVAQLLLRNPSLTSEFTSLYHGSYTPAKEGVVDGIPVVDTFLIAQIIHLNCFGCPPSSLESHFDASGGDAEKSYKSCGIWTYASYINHSCLNNVQRSFIGDMQIVRATRNIPADTEVLFWYASPTASDRAEILQRTWGFECSCCLCIEHKRTSQKVLRQRKGFLSDLKATLENPLSIDLARTQRLLAALEKTYKTPAIDVPRVQLQVPYIHLVRACAVRHEPVQVVEVALKALGSIGFVLKGGLPGAGTPLEVEHWGLVLDGVIELWIHLWAAYRVVAPELCTVAERYARTTYKICIGEDTTFDQKYGIMMQYAIRS